jgi:hypothetical protein
MKGIVRQAGSIALSFSIVILTGCGGEKVDGSSEGKLTGSLKSISQNIALDKKEIFDSALITIKTRYRNQSDFAKAIDGMSADDVIQKGTEAKKELTTIKNNQLQEYREKLIAKYKSDAERAKARIEEDRKQYPEQTANFLKDRRKGMINVSTEQAEKFQSMSAEEFEAYATEKGWKPDYSKI